MGELSGAGNRIPDYRREIDELKRENRKLWAALRNGPTQPPVQKEIVFSWSGTVSGTKVSGPWLAPSNLFITGVVMSQATAPGSTTTATLLLNGSSVGTYSLGAGSGRGGTTRRITVRTGDRIQLSIAGGGGSDLVANVSYVTDTGV